MFIHSISPELFTIGPLSLRWYGLLFVTGIILNFLLIRHIFKKEGFPMQHLESLAIYLLVGLVLGARLGHAFFYNADYFLSNPIELLYVWNGGLASHGAAIGLLVSYSLWIWIHKVKFAKYVDIFVIGFPITAGFVRLGNFFNSEIVGRATNSDFGVVFTRLGEDFPRHPSQLYEAALSFMIFFILYWVYKKYKDRLPQMFLLFLYVFLYFITRFFVEYWKERHVLSYDIPLSMGQFLSIVPVVIAICYFLYILIRKKSK